jgi:hypothetical protein
MKLPDSEDALTAGLRAVAEDDEQRGASSRVGMRLLAEVQAIAAARRRRTALLSLSAAAAVLLALLVPGWRMFQQTTTTLPQAADAPVVTRELVTEFFPLTYSNVPVRGGYVVRMQVPRGALASFGATLAAAGDNASPNVLADVVIGNDGLARAVRFVQVIHNERQEQTP